MRSIGNLFRDDPFEFLQFLHQIALGLQSARGVEDADIVRFRDGFLASSKDDGAGIRTVFPLDDVATDSFRPNAELLDGSGSKRVAGAEEDSIAFSGEAMGKFRDRSRFARAVDADDEDNRGARFGASQRGLFAAESTSQFFADDLKGLVHIDPAAAELRVDRVPDFRSHPVPHIGFNEDGEEFFQEIIIDQPAFRLPKVAYVGVEQFIGFAQCPAPPTRFRPVVFAVSLQGMASDGGMGGRRGLGVVRRIGLGCSRLFWCFRFGRIGFGPSGVFGFSIPESHGGATYASSMKGWCHERDRWITG